MGDYVNRLVRLYDVNVRMPRIRTLLPQFREDDFSDDAFFDRFRFTKDGFNQLMHFIGDDIPEPENNRGHPMSPRTQVLVALRYYATGSFQIVHGDLQGVSQPSASRLVKRVSGLLTRKRAEVIRFPIGQEAVENKRKFYEQYGFPDVLGCVDGVHVPIEAPSLDEREIYRCRKGFMSLNVQGIADTDLKFINIVNRWPGSTHDSRIFDNSRICFQLEQRQFEGLLLGDKGYACLPFLMTQFRNPAGRAQRRYNRSHKSTRSAVEIMFGIWKRKFPCLKQGIRVKLDTAMSVITATAVLHNIAIDLKEPDVGEEAEAEDDDVPVVDRDDNVMGAAIRQTIVQQHFQ
ncbi:putative nuclease HARBI1 [Lineus longissimus]|uniref:putative nuclease HARBI1 n=1 Tax=Lineus longissimus TaxID=88925 RepID=UPI00315DA683